MIWRLSALCDYSTIDDVAAHASEEAAPRGLSLSAENVRRSGGDIRFTTRDGRGTRFEICLPVDGRPVAPVPARLRTRRSLQVLRSRVLIIDDEPSILRAFRRVLAPRHDVVIAASGQQALDTLEQDTALDGIICDFSMADVDAIRVYQVVAERDRELADLIVFCTGGPMNRRSREFLEATSNTVLEKPVAAELLLGAIEQLGKR